MNLSILPFDYTEFYGKIDANLMDVNGFNSEFKDSELHFKNLARFQELNLNLNSVKRPLV